MKIVKYNKLEHLSQLEEWNKQWNIPASYLDCLSTTGLIIENHACLFIYETNSPLVMFENLVSNKNLSKEDRKKSLDLLINKAILFVKEQGYKKIMITTNNEKILNRAEESGWEKPNRYQIIFKDLITSETN